MNLSKWKATLVLPILFSASACSDPRAEAIQAEKISAQEAQIEMLKSEIEARGTELVQVEKESGKLREQDLKKIRERLVAIEGISAEKIETLRERDEIWAAIKAHHAEQEEQLRIVIASLGDLTEGIQTDRFGTPGMSHVAGIIYLMKEMVVETEAENETLKKEIADMKKESR